MSDCVDLFVIDSAWSESAVARAYTLLLPDEQARVQRMRGERLQSQLTVSLYVRRPLLAQVLSVSADDIELGRDSNGKPFVVNYPCHFNIADTGGCVVVGVSTLGPIGVDVEEKTRKIKDLQGFASHCLSAREQEFMGALSESERLPWLLKAWTIKEAYAKCLGEGLSYGLTRIETNPTAQAGQCLLDDNCSDMTSYYTAIWSDWLEHHVALCAQNAKNPPRMHLLGETGFLEAG